MSNKRRNKLRELSFENYRPGFHTLPPEYNPSINPTDIKLMPLPYPYFDRVSLDYQIRKKMLTLGSITQHKIAFESIELAIFNNDCRRISASTRRTSCPSRDNQEILLYLRQRHQKGVHWGKDCSYNSGSSLRAPCTSRAPGHMHICRNGPCMPCHSHKLWCTCSSRSNHPSSRHLRQPVRIDHLVFRCNINDI